MATFFKTPEIIRKTVLGVISNQILGYFEQILGHFEWILGRFGRTFRDYE